MAVMDPEFERHRRTWIGFTWFIKISIIVIVITLACMAIFLLLIRARGSPCERRGRPEAFGSPAERDTDQAADAVGDAGCGKTDRQLTHA